MSADWLPMTGDLWRYLSLPVISALVGYFTNVLAIRMMFHPVEFRGWCKPWLGWQGVIPRNASKMTGIAVDIITESLLSAEEMFERLDPGEIATEIEGPLLAMTDEVLDTVMMRHHPGLWQAMPDTVRRGISYRLRTIAPDVVAQVMQDVRDNVDQLFDLKSMITRRLVNDKPLINRIFKQIGHDEFVFVGRSGAYFGFAFGLIQMLVWLFYQPWWVLPLFGLLVGWATNWLALKIIFNPKRPVKVGPFTLQGLFFRRQQDVAADYGGLVADKIITPENVLAELVEGPYAKKLEAIVEQQISAAIDDTMEFTRPLRSWQLGEREYQLMKADVEHEFMARMPELLTRMTGYIHQRMGVRQILEERLRALTPKQFEAMLRPAFEEDEWILVAVGATLGFAAGWLQLISLFAQVFEQQLGGLW